MRGIERLFWATLVVLAATGPATAQRKGSPLGAILFYVTEIDTAVRELDTKLDRVKQACESSAAPAEKRRAYEFSN